MNIFNPLIKIKWVFLNLGFKTKLLVLAATIVMMTLPSGVFLYNSIKSNDKEKITEATTDNNDSKGEVAGESISENQNGQSSSNNLVKKESPTPNTSSTKQSQPNGNNSSNNNNSPSTNSSSNSTSTNTTNSQSSNPTPNPSPGTNSNSSSPSPSPVTNSGPFEASWVTIERNAEHNYVNGNISANKNLKKCNVEYSAQISPNGGFGGNISGSMCNFSIGDPINNPNLRISNIVVTLESVEGDSKQLSAF